MPVSQPSIIKLIPMKCDPAPGPSSPIQITVSTPRSFYGSLINVNNLSSAISVGGRNSLVPCAKFIGTSNEPPRSSPSTLKRIMWATSAQVSDDVIQLNFFNACWKSVSTPTAESVELKSCIYEAYLKFI